MFVVFTALSNISSCCSRDLALEHISLLLAFQNVYLGLTRFSCSTTGLYIRGDSLNVYIFCTNRQWVGVVWLRAPWSSAGFLHNHKSISVLNLFRCYSSHLSVHSMCSSRLLPHSECITPKTFIPCQTVHLYAQIHFTDSFLSLLSYLHSLHCSSAEEGKQAARWPAA